MRGALISGSSIAHSAWIRKPSPTWRFSGGGSRLAQLVTARSSAAPRASDRRGFRMTSAYHRDVKGFMAVLVVLAAGTPARAQAGRAPPTPRAAGDPGHAQPPARA